MLTYYIRSYLISNMTCTVNMWLIDVNVVMNIWLIHVNVIPQYITYTNDELDTWHIHVDLDTILWHITYTIICLHIWHFNLNIIPFYTMYTHIFLQIGHVHSCITSNANSNSACILIYYKYDMNNPADMTLMTFTCSIMKCTLTYNFKYVYTNIFKHAYTNISHTHPFRMHPDCMCEQLQTCIHSYITHIYPYI